MSKYLIYTLVMAVAFLALPSQTTSRIATPEYFTFVDRENPETGEIEGTTIPSYQFYSSLNESNTFEIPLPRKQPLTSDNCTELNVTGDSENRMDIIFIATHFYPDIGPDSKFASDVELMKSKFNTFPKFAGSLDKINFYRVDDIDPNDECYEIGMNPVCLNKTKLINMASQCAGYDQNNNDQIVVLFNGDVAPFGAAIAEKGFAYMPSNMYLFMIHEFGHSFAGLGDEYDKHVPPTTNLEPEYPNCASTTPGFTCSDKWGDKMGNGVGCYNTCGYTNWQRPTFNNSVMRDHRTDHFCPVSEEVVSDFLSIYKDPPPPKKPIKLRYRYKSF
ncbi:hypothetical protein ACFL04_02625 [Patescibacteria group bacterium]